MSATTVKTILDETHKGGISLNAEIFVRIGDKRFKVRTVASYDGERGYGNPYLEIMVDEDEADAHIRWQASKCVEEFAKQHFKLP